MGAGQGERKLGEPGLGAGQGLVDERLNLLPARLAGPHQDDDEDGRQGDREPGRAERDAEGDPGCAGLVE
jgi:hypothetical protein